MIIIKDHIGGFFLVHLKRVMLYKEYERES